jgi:hypothetical protein
MKARTLLTITAFVAMAFTVNAADLVASPRALALADSYKKVGSAPGEKIDRVGMTMSPRQHQIHTSTDKSGSAPGDKFVRATLLVSPRMQEATGIKIAPLK